MKVYTCFLLFGAFAYTHSSPVTKPIEDKRAPNITLKRIPEIKDKETSKNDSIATNKIVVGVTNIPQPHSTVETFTDFMQELLIILNTYNDVIFKDFVDIVHKDIKENIQGNQNELQNLLVKESNFLMKKSVAEKKAAINQIVSMMNLLKIFDPNVRELLDYIDSLYRKEATIKFQNMLRDLRGYSTGYGNSKTKDGFVRLVRECVRATVFIHGNLNTDVERTLKKYTDTILKKYKQFYSFTSASSTTNSVNLKPIISQTKSYTNTVKISDYNISTVNKTPITSLKLNPTKTTAHIKNENKIIGVFRTDTNENNQEDAAIRHETSFKLNTTNITTHTKEENKRIRTESNQEDPTATNETSKRGESNSQQKNTTHTRANDNATEEFFYMTTEKPEIVFKSESKSKLVEKMLGENSTEKQVIAQSNTTPRKRFSIKNESKEGPKKLLARHSLKQYTTKKDLRRSAMPPFPGEEPSIEIFDRDRRRRRKKTHTRTSKFTTERPELKDYLKRVRQLQRNLQELKLINELNHIENNRIDEYKTKDKKPRNKRKESKKIKISKSEVQREQTKVDDTEKDVKDTNGVNKDREVLGRDVEIKDDTHHLSHKVIHKNKDRKSKFKKTIKATRYKDIASNGTDVHEPKYKKPRNKRKESKDLKKRKYSYEHKKKDTRSKSKKTTKEADTFTEPIKHKSKKLAFKFSEALSTTKDNTVNKKHAKTRLKTSKVNYSVEDLTNTNSVSEHREDLGRIAKIKDMKHKKKDTRSKSKKTTKAAETSTTPYKYRSKKKLVFESSMSLSTAKDKAVNKKHAKSRLKISKNPKRTTWNVSEKITQSSIEETTTKGNIQITDYDKNKTTAYSLRRLLVAFPSLFEKQTLEGLYPAHLWN